MFDSHCHLNFPEYHNRLKKDLEQCLALNINQWMIPGVDINSQQQFIQLKSDYNLHFYFALGLHPYFIDQHSIETMAQLEKQTHECNIQAIGETGLDAFQQHHSLQLKLLTRHFELASQLKLPIILHHRKTQPELLKIAKRFPSVKGVIHAFSGSFEQAQQWIDLGYLLGVGGIITYERASKTKSTFSKIDLSNLLLETDGPSMPINGHQGKVNAPSNLLTIAEHLSEVKQTSLLEIDTQTTLNAKGLFGEI